MGLCLRASSAAMQRAVQQRAHLGDDGRRRLGAQRGQRGTACERGHANSKLLGCCEVARDITRITPDPDGHVTWYTFCRAASAKAPQMAARALLSVALPLGLISMSTAWPARSIKLDPVPR